MYSLKEYDKNISNELLYKIRNNKYNKSYFDILSSKFNAFISFILEKFSINFILSFFETDFKPIKKIDKLNRFDYNLENFKNIISVDKKILLHFYKQILLFESFKLKVSHVSTINFKSFEDFMWFIENFFNDQKSLSILNKNDNLLQKTLLLFNSFIGYRTKLKVFDETEGKIIYKSEIEIKREVIDYIVENVKKGTIKSKLYPIYLAIIFDIIKSETDIFNEKLVKVRQTIGYMIKTMIKERTFFSFRNSNFIVETILQNHECYKYPSEMYYEYFKNEFAYDFFAITKRFISNEFITFLSSDTAFTPEEYEFFEYIFKQVKLIRYIGIDGELLTLLIEKLKIEDVNVITAYYKNLYEKLTTLVEDFSEKINKSSFLKDEKKDFILNIKMHTNNINYGINVLKHFESKFDFITDKIPEFSNIVMKSSLPSKEYEKLIKKELRLKNKNIGLKITDLEESYDE